jgi:hypothetical protein
VRELLLGSHRFNDIERGLPGISRSLLSSRLRDLEQSGIIERLPSTRSNGAEYHFSDAGRELKPVIEAPGGRSTIRSRRNWTRGSWSGKFTSGSIASAYRTNER